MKTLGFRTRTHRARGALVVALAGIMSSAGARGGEAKTPAAIFTDMKTSFAPAKAKGVWAKYQWNLSGPAGGQWWISVSDGSFTMGTGTIEKPDVTFVASDADWVSLCNGSLGGMRAFLTGRLKVTGNIGLARKLDDMFP